MFMKHYAPNRCEPSIEVIMKMGIQWGVSRFFVCFFFFFFFFLGGGGGWGDWCQGGCERERRIEVIVKIYKKKIGGGGQVRVDVNGEFNFFVKMQKR